MRYLVPCLVFVALGCTGLLGEEPGKDDTSSEGGGTPGDRDGDGTPDGSDCDPGDPNAYPGATERCNGFDDNCDGEVDEGLLIDVYEDADGDGYGDGDAEEACEATDGYATRDGDCKDNDAKYYPGAPEKDCTDDNDYNCDGSTAYADDDKDGYPACEDCNDDDKSVHTSTSEKCNGKDDDCDGKIDDNASDCIDMYEDSDGDGYGSDEEVCGCEDTAGYSTRTGDCDDRDADINPGQNETCGTSYDDDCDGKTNDYSGGSSPSVNAGRDDDVGGASADCEESGYGYECDSCDRVVETIGSSATATDADGDTMTYKWTVSPSGPTIDSSTSLSTDVTFPTLAPDEPGECKETDYTFTLTVTDCAGEKGTDTVVYTLSCCGR